MVGAVQSCSDDTVATPITAPTGQVGDNTTFNTLSFSWQEVKGAVQYSYQLYMTDVPEKIISTEVTQDNSCTFTDLQPSTSYTLKVVAYPSLHGGQTLSDPLLLTARTSDIIKLATPANLTAEQPKRDVILTWDAVENADAYEYTIETAAGVMAASGSVSVTTATVSGLEPGMYVASVKAVIDRAGYADSDAASVEFEYVEKKLVIWSVDGTYYSCILDEEWEATIVYYEDGTYSIKSWYGVDGYDLNFSTEERNDEYGVWYAIEPLASEYSKSGNYYSVPTGRSSNPKTVYVYTDDYSYMEGEEITLSVWNDGANAWDYDYFSFATPASKFAGTWTLTYSGDQYVDDDVDEEFDDRVETITITAIDANTISMTCPWYNEYKIQGTIDLENKTITFPMKAIAPGYYIFGSYDYDTKQWCDAVATINDNNTIEFEEFDFISGGYSWLWGYGTMTRN